jgi:hypothetical protein
VATRAGFGDTGIGGTYLPYDPRNPDMGIELGGDVNGWYGRMAITNGPANLLGASNTTVDGRSAKFGYNTSWYQGGFSVYEQSGGTVQVRSDRWAYSALAHHGPVAFIGEIGAGTDVDPFAVGKINLLAGFAELDYAPTRWSNVRVRYDRQELDRDRGEAIAEANTFTRYALEGEFVPVPFAELRWAVRYIQPASALIHDQRQAYLQFHFSY